MLITRGKQRKGVKFVVYGPEGIGKSTFVSKIPGIVFIDTEGSTGEMDVLRMPAPTSWNMLLGQVDYAVAHPEEVKALVIDTGDWAERLCMTYVLSTHTINGKPADTIEAYGYGKGYTYLYEEFGKLLDKMTLMSEHGQHCGFTAHAKMRKFEEPNESGSYDRWEMKMSKQVAPLVKEWASIVLFANYKTYVYATDDKGKKHKASGGQRVMFTTHHPCWDAKNRYSLPEELPFDFASVAQIFEGVDVKPAAAPVGQMVQDVAPVAPVASVAPVVQSVPAVSVAPALPVEAQKPVQNQTMEDVLNTGGTTEELEKKLKDKSELEKKVDQAVVDNADYTGVPQALADLMKTDGITPFEVRAAIAQRGYFPLDTPFQNYPADFVQGVLIGAWPQVKAMVIQNRANQPF